MYIKQVLRTGRRICGVAVYFLWEMERKSRTKLRRVVGERDAGVGLGREGKEDGVCWLLAPAGADRICRP